MSQCLAGLFSNPDRRGRFAKESSTAFDIVYQWMPSIILQQRSFRKHVIIGFLFQSSTEIMWLPINDEMNEVPTGKLVINEIFHRLIACWNKAKVLMSLIWLGASDFVMANHIRSFSDSLQTTQPPTCSISLCYQIIAVYGQVFNENIS